MAYLPANLQKAVYTNPGQIGPGLVLDKKLVSVFYVAIRRSTVCRMPPFL